MGVPKFYKWLSERYPLINQLANSEVKPEFDNMYLDMNGIVHNCTHSDVPEEGSGGKALSDEQMYSGIFKYLDKLFCIAKPRKLLYMAIDGVAPRAKMNQQRQRRFRAAKDAREHLEDMRRKGEDVDASAVFDSNCITPGTAFMNTLSDHIRYFIRKKIKEDVAWQGVRVIFSGAEVPGEGEHKIMNYIRAMKSQPGYEPNLRHVLYGLDADLVMLSLASHEPSFALLREEVIFGNARMPRKVAKKEGEFQFLHISLLREYIDLEFRTALLSPQAATPLQFEYDLERIVDDWVILAFFVGNDFLPHLPTLDIGEGGLDTLFAIYKEELPLMGGYIFQERKIDWKRLERITRRMGALEESIFAERQEAAIEFARKAARKNRREERAHAVIEISEDALFDGESQPSPSPDTEALLAGIAASLAEGKEAADAAAAAAAEAAAAAAAAPKIFDSQLSMLMRAKDAPQQLDEDSGAVLDYESLSFKSRYYREKYPEWFDRGVALARDVSGSGGDAPEARLSSAQNVRLLVQNYAQGLKWVAAYYYEGCRSWKWYFSYRYAPLASDIIDLDQLDLSLQLGYPFRPMEQLLGVLPPASGKFLPAAYRSLMDPRTSSVADFYPVDFSIDMNGKRSAWEGIALIPFIDESRLLKALGNISQSQLTESERKRNERYGDEWVIEYDESNKATVPATLPFFNPITECHSRQTVWKLPAIPMTAEERRERDAYEADTRERAKADPSLLPVPVEYAGNFQPRLCPGLVYPTQGYPSIVHSVEANNGSLSAALQKVAVNVFGMESRKESLVVTLKRTLDVPGSGPNVAAALAQRFVNQRVFVDWPYLKEGLLSKITDANTVWTSSGGKSMSQTEAATHRTECALIQGRLLQTKAVEVGPVQLLCAVHPFVGMKRSPSGAVVRSFADEAINVPWSLVFPTMSNPDPRYAELPPPVLADAYPPGTAIVYTGPQFYGSLGRVLALAPKGNTVSVALDVAPPEAAFGRTIANGSKLQFYPSYLVSKSLSIHPLVLSKICSSVFVSQERTDIGLKVKFSKQGLQVPEYARRVEAWGGAGSADGAKRAAAAAKNNEAAGGGSGGSAAQQGNNEGWEYSEKCVALLAAYKRRFPLLFDMMNEEPSTFKYDAERLVAPVPLSSSSSSGAASPLGKTAADAVAEIYAWLQTVGINSLVLVPCTSTLMAERGIKAIEAESARLDALRTAAGTKEVRLDGVPIHHLYRADPVVAWSPSENHVPDLGDRVLSLRSDSGAPFGARGTVVAVHSSPRHAEVVFDRVFLNGTHLNHKCSNLRGQTLALTAILNLTTPRVLAPKGAEPPKQQQQQKAAQPQQQVQHQQQQQKHNNQPQAQQQQPQAQPQRVQPVAAAAAAPAAAPIQILKRPIQQAASAQQAPVPAAASAAAGPADVNAASAQLKQMLNIGGGAPAPAAAPAQQVSAPASAAAAPADDVDADPMQRLLNKGKARKAKPAVTSMVPPPVMMMGSGPPPPMGFMPGPGPYGPPHPMHVGAHGMPHGMVPPQGFLPGGPPPPFMHHPGPGPYPPHMPPPGAFPQQPPQPHPQPPQQQQHPQQ